MPGDDTPRDVTLGEVWRGQQALGQRVDRVARDVGEIKATLAAEGVKVGVVWAGLGVGGAAFVLALVDLVIRTRG